MNELLTALILLVAAILISGYSCLAIAMFHDTADRDPYHRYPGWPSPPPTAPRRQRALPRTGNDHQRRHHTSTPTRPSRWHPHRPRTLGNLGNRGTLEPPTPLARPRRNPMTQPVPPGNITRLCVICYHHGRRTPATCVTIHRGYALCDDHAEHTNTQIRATLLGPKNPR